MDGMTRNLRIAVRSLKNHRAFALSSVLLVGLGVGAVTTIFTAVDHVILRPLPYPGADRMVYMTNGSHSGVVLRELPGLQTWEDWVGTTEANVILTGAGEPQRLNEAHVTEGFFPFFGARPALGRLLIPSDNQDLDVVVLSHGAWQTYWGGDPEIVGKSIVLDDEPVTVAGVVSESFPVPQALVEPDVHIWRALDWSNPDLEKPDHRSMSVVARLRPEIDVEAADQEVAALADRMAERYPDSYVLRDGRNYRWPVVPLQDYTVRDWDEGLYLLLAAVGLLLLVACANVAHLFLARGLSREREVAVRRALGADSGSLIGYLLTEATLVGLAGGVLGVTLAWLGLRAFEATFPAQLPAAGEISLDLRVLTVALVISLCTALLFGLLPGMKTLGRDVSAGLHGGGRSQTASRGMRRLRSGLVVAEVALSLILVAEASLLLRSFLVTTTQETGVTTENLWVVVLNPTTPQDVDEYKVLSREIMESVDEVPGVAMVSRALTAPFQYTGGNRCCWGNGINDPEDPDARISVSLHPVDRSYFPANGIELLAGRLWDEQTSYEDPVSGVINETMAIRLFGSAQAAVGREVQFGEVTRLVTGVASDTRHYGLDRPVGADIYLPFPVLPFNIPMLTLLIRTDGEVPGLAASVRRGVWAADPNLPVPSVVPIRSTISDSMGVQRFSSLLFVVFGGIALLLAAGGLYGTLLYAVGQREKELGIRMALGANPLHIQRRVLFGGLWVSLIGTGVGLFGAWGVGRTLESMLYGVTPTDALALGGAASVLMLTAALASWIPARRAARTDPLRTLNAE
jgi:predicted permease